MYNTRLVTEITNLYPSPRHTVDRRSATTNQCVPPGRIHHQWRCEYSGWRSEWAFNEVIWTVRPIERTAISLAVSRWITWKVARCLLSRLAVDKPTHNVAARAPHLHGVGFFSAFSLAWRASSPDVSAFRHSPQPDWRNNK